jgi:hypothetical protein
MMNRRIRKRFLTKSIFTYLLILLSVTIIKKYFSGGGRGRIERHHEITWTKSLKNMPYNALGSLLILYPFVVVYYRNAKKENDEKSSKQ